MIDVNGAWVKIFSKYPIIQKIITDGYYIITADEIKEFKEPRLMTYIDRRDRLPKIFKDNQLSILSVTNSSYIIFKDSLFRTFPSIENITNRLIPEIYEVPFNYSKFVAFNDYKNMTSESKVIDFAHFILLLEYFVNDGILYLAFRGRERILDKFQIKLPEVNLLVNIEGSQFEIDAGYESDNKIYLFEIKKGKIKDFNIRQIYYPYKALSTKYTSKEIIPLLLIHDEDKIYIIQFSFGDVFGDIKCVKSKCYIIKGG